MVPNSRMVTLDSDVFKCCRELKTLGWQNDVEAKRLLQCAADQVKPIMARRSWAVPLLAEFYPQPPNLLGLNHNHGERIDIRLRSPSDKSSFLPYSSILGTLLHELVHIQVGPHNAAFYKLLDQLNRECDQLIASANNTANHDNFVGNGQRLGDWASNNVPRHLAHEKALAAAQKRQRLRTIMSRGGQRLGGTAEIARLCDPREMALAAAERRRRDDIWCASAREPSSLPSADDVIIVDDNQPQQVIVVSDGEDVDQPDHQRDQPPTPPGPNPSPVQVPLRRNPAALAALRRAGHMA